jgi:PRTRC genetic system protein A
MRPIGYLTNFALRREGQPGIFYDYLLAGNGLWIEASGAWLTARIQIADCPIRGLVPLEQVVDLRFGKVPQYYFDLVVSEMMKTPEQERYAAITFDDQYHIEVPAQVDGVAAVEYDNPSNVVVDLHSHGRMRADFSPTDDEDDQGLRISGVIGNIDTVPNLKLRVGVYGYYAPVLWGDVFDGKLGLADAPPRREKEVPDFDIHGGSEIGDSIREFFNRRLWWHWGVRRGGPLPPPGQQ